MLSYLNVMPLYFYWGEDSYQLQQAVNQLRDRVLDPDWIAFNYDRFPADATIAGLNQAMTPPMGAGDRFVWLQETTLVQQCPDPIWQELERTLKALPETTHLLLTLTGKPDGRLKSTKRIKQTATVKEFSLLPPWDTDGILKQVKAAASEQKLNLSDQAAELLAEAVGNDSRKLNMELEKLALLQGDQSGEAITPIMVQQLVPASAYNSFQLAGSLLKRDLNRALDILTHLLDQNEPALKIVAVLVGQFRTWLWVKLMIEQGERNPKMIAQMAEIGNPNRVYFLQKEVQSISSHRLYQSLNVLLDLELMLKTGRPERESFQTALIQISQTD